MARLKPQFADPNSKFINGRKYKIVKVKRHRIHPSNLAGAMTFGQTIVESLMERYPWVVIENVWDWSVYKISLWNTPKFSVPISSSGRTISVEYKKPKVRDWVLLSAKKTNR